MATKKEIIIGAVALVVGLTVGVAVDGPGKRGAYYTSNKYEYAGRMPHSQMNQGEMPMDVMMGGMLANMRGKTGAELEKVFLDDMIAHHAGAVEMAALLKAGTTRAELLEFAYAIINVQTKEIEQMRAWRAAWFPPEQI